MPNIFFQEGRKVLQGGEDPLLATHIKHCQSTVLCYGRRVEFITNKQFTDFF